MNSLKKIALAMVAAMTLGMVAVAPANAAVMTVAVDLALIKGDVTDLDFVLVTLNKFLQFDNEIIEKTKTDFIKLRKFQPYVINKNLTWVEFSKINSNLFILNGVQPFISMERHYNYPYEFAHVLGYVGVPNENDLQNQKDDLFRTPGIKIGKLGIEKILNRELIGTPGFTRF